MALLSPLLLLPLLYYYPPYMCISLLVNKRSNLVVDMFGGEPEMLK